MTNPIRIELNSEISHRALTGLEQAFLGVPSCLNAKVYLKVLGSQDEEGYQNVVINFENLWLACHLGEQQKRPLSGSALTVERLTDSSLELAGPGIKPMTLALTDALDAASRCVKELRMAQKASEQLQPLLFEHEEASPAAAKLITTRLEELVKFSKEYPSHLKAQQETFGKWLNTTLQFKSKDGTSYDIEVFPVVVGLMKQAKSKQTAAEFIAPVFATFRAHPQDMVQWLKSLDWKVVKWGATLLKDPQGHGYGALFENEKNINGISAQAIWEQCEFQTTVTR